MPEQLHTINAKAQVLGRLASQVATILIGKHKPEYEPHLDKGDKVKVINIDKIKITGNKLNNKLYYRHTNYPGGLKTKKMKEFSRKELFQKAVWNMLPKNKLRKKRFFKLEIE